MRNRLPWGHRSRHCIYCGKVAPRTRVVGGYAHKRCIPRAELEVQKVKPVRRVPFQSSGSGYAVTGVDASPSSSRPVDSHRTGVEPEALVEADRLQREAENG